MSDEEIIHKREPFLQVFTDAPKIVNMSKVHHIDTSDGKVTSHIISSDRQNKTVASSVQSVVQDGEDASNVAESLV